MKMVRFLLFINVLFLLACNATINHPSELYQWINDVDNGLVKTKSVNNFDISVKFLPSEYLAYNELKYDDRIDWEKFDVLKKEHDGFLTFLLTIAPSSDPEIAPSNDPIDIMYYQVQNQEEYERRFIQLNFNVNESLTLNAGGQRYEPVLHTMENTYELSKKKSLYLVFPKEEGLEQLQILDLVFEDRFFDTGISHFIFQTEDLIGLPPFDISAI